MNRLRVTLSHDVDRVRKTYQYASHDLRRLSVVGLRRAFYRGRRDPYWCFPRIRDLEEQRGIRSTFFFLEESKPFRPSNPSEWRLSLGKYRFDEPAIQKELRLLHAGGWEVGLHGSYESYRSLDLLRREKERLESSLGSSVHGIRQHHLNLDPEKTWRYQIAAGLTYDASVGVRANIGLPNGATGPFRDESSGQRVLPIHIMDGYLFSAYPRHADAWDACRQLIDQVQDAGGVLSLLWHQRVFDDTDFPGWGAFYGRLLDECRSRNAEFLLCREAADLLGAEP